MKIEDLFKDNLPDHSENNAENIPVFSDEMKERIYSRIQRKQSDQQNGNESSDSVSGVEGYKRPILRRVLEFSASAAAVVLIAVNGLSIKGKNNINGNDNDFTSQIVTTSHNYLNSSVTTTVTDEIVTETAYGTTSTTSTTTAVTEDVISTSVSQIETENNSISDSNNDSQTNEDSSQNDNISHSSEEPDFIPYNVFIKNDMIAQTVPPVITKDSYYYFGDLVTIYEIKDDMVRITENGKSPEMWTPISNTAEITYINAKLKTDTKIRTITIDRDTKEKNFNKTEDKSQNDIVTIYFMDEKWAKISLYDNEWLQTKDLEIIE